MSVTHYPKSREIYSHTGLRGIAAISVVIAHFSQPETDSWIHYQNIFRFFHWCGDAVNLFFILSGFILNWVYLSSEALLNWASYIRARVARIMPLYYLTAALFLPVPFFSILKRGLAYVGLDYPRTVVLNVFMISGIIDGFHHTINGPAWSISVEFFCYLALFPLLVLSNRLLLKNRLGVMVSVFLIGFFTFCLFRCGGGDQEVLVKISHWEWDISWLGRGIFGFSIGFFLCSIYRICMRRPPIPLAINLIFLMVVVVFVLTRIEILPSNIVTFVLPLLVFCTAFDLGVGASILKMQPFQWLGERSYSIYLWHMPLLCFQIFLFSLTRKVMPTGPWDRALLLLIVLVISELSYRYFEVPSRNYIRNLIKKPSVAA